MTQESGLFLTRKQLPFYGSSHISLFIGLYKER